MQVPQLHQQGMNLALQRKQVMKRLEVQLMNHQQLRIVSLEIQLQPS